MKSRVLIAIVFCVCIPSLLVADARPLREAKSANDRYRMNITEGRPNTSPAQPCRATLRVKSERGPWDKCWDRPLVNEVAPEQAFIRDDGGFVVTLNEHARGGARNALVVYGADGRFLRHLLITDLLDGDDWKQAKIESQAIRWLNGAQCRFEDDDLFVIRTSWSKEIRLSLRTLQLVDAKGAPMRTAAGAVPAEIAAVLGGRVVEVAEKPAETQPTVEEKPLAESPKTATAPAKPTDNGESQPTVAVEPAAPSAAPQPNWDKPVDYVAWLQQGDEQRLKAGEIYQAAFKALKPWSGEASAYEAALKGDAATLESAAVAEWLTTNLNVVMFLRSAAQAPAVKFACERGRGPTLFDVQLPAVDRMRQLADFTLIAGRSFAHAGRTDEAVVRALDVLAMGMHLADGPTIVEAQVGGEIEADARRLLADLVAGGAKLDAAAVRKRLEPVRRATASFDDVITFEQAAALSLLQYAYARDERSGKLALDPRRVFETLRLIDGAVSASDVREMCAAMGEVDSDAVLREFNTFYESARHAAHEKPAKARELFDELEKHRSRTANQLLAAVAPPFRDFQAVHAQAASCRQGFDLVLSVLERAQQDGAPPDALTGVSAAELMDPASGEPFVYRRRGEQFVLYGVGENGKDDGGRGDDLHVWPPAAR